MTRTQLNEKIRWTPVDGNPSLVQLSFKNCDMWYTLDGTTVNSLADALKYTIMDKYVQSLLGIKMSEVTA